MNFGRKLIVSPERGVRSPNFWSFLSFWGESEVKLVRFVFFLVKEDDGLGGEVVDSCPVGGLSNNRSTSLSGT